MTEMPPHAREALDNILNYLVDENSHFEAHCSDVTGKPFDLDDWNGDLESIPEEARDHVYYYALILEHWIKQSNDAIHDDIFLHDHLIKNHFKLE